MSDSYLEDCYYGCTDDRLLLNHIGSLKYYEDAKFRDKINKKVEDEELKLNINCSRNDEIEDVSVLSNTHTLNLSYYKNISNVNVLSNVHDLNLSDCKKISDVSNSTIFKLI